LKEYTTSWTCTGTWPAQTYGVGATAILISVPSCVGDGLSTTITETVYTISAPANAFVSITTTPQISIYTTDPAVASATAYTVSVVSKELYTNMSVTKTFQLTITCAVISVDMTGSITSFTYYNGDASVNTNIPTYTVFPNCGSMPITYTL